MRPRTLSARRRRCFAAALLLAVATGLTLAPGAWADWITPQAGGSPNADRIHSLYLITLAIAAVVFVLVEGALIYSLVKFRARKGRIAAQIHGNTRLELGWTLAAALILVVLTVVTFVKLGGIDNPDNSGAGGLKLGEGVLVASTDRPTPPDGRKLNVCVTGRQYIWRFTYSDNCSDTFGKVFSYEEMVVPAQTTVVLDIRSTDVAHSWWVPKLGGKFDAVPGYTNYTWFKAPRAGVTYRGQCAELCGRNHADMFAQVRVVTPPQYQAWLAAQKRYIASADRLSAIDRDILKRRNEL